jgi:hypothetical protein
MSALTHCQTCVGDTVQYGYFIYKWVQISITLYCFGFLSAIHNFGIDPLPNMRWGHIIVWMMIVCCRYSRPLSAGGSET